MLKLYATLLLTLSLGACAPFAPDKMNSDFLNLPDNYVSQGSEIVANEKWWSAFNSNTLDGLIDTALSSNFDLQMAYSSLRQAEASARKAGASYLPGLEGSASAVSTRQDNSRSIIASDSLSLNLAATYELDLWGRVRSLQESELANVSARQEDIQTSRMTIAAEVATNWIDLVATQAEIEIVKRQIQTNKVLLEAIAFRFGNSLSTGLDVLQQQGSYTASQADLPLLYAQQQRLQNSLAVLLGQMPGNEQKIIDNVLPTYNATNNFNFNLPINIMLQRPDVRAAWHDLSSSQWDISAAKADQFPRLHLSADIATSGPSSILFTQWVANLIANITAQIFDGGYRSAELDRVQAVAEEKVQVYAKTVANAISDIQNAMINVQKQAEYVKLLETRLNLAQIAEKEAVKSYLNGRDSFLLFATQHKEAESLEITVLRQKSTLLNYQIALHRALGGDI